MVRPRTESPAPYGVITMLHRARESQSLAELAGYCLLGPGEGKGWAWL